MQARYVSHSAVSTGCSGVPPTAAGVFQQSGHLPAYPRRGYPEGPPRADVIHGATSTARRTVIADLGVWPGWVRRGLFGSEALGLECFKIVICKAELSGLRKRCRFASVRFVSRLVVHAWALNADRCTPVAAVLYSLK